jgi:putative flavoprotein involved in K+ transport
LQVEPRDGEPVSARAVVWAAGEAQYPRTNGLPGAHLGVPTIDVRHWDRHPGDDVVVVGGYESGIDAAVQLVDRGRRVTVLDREEPWSVVDPDPSRTLSPYTHARLRRAVATGQLTLEGGASIAAIAAGDPRGFEVRATDGRSWHADGPPLLATGFDGSLTLVRDRFAFDEHGRVQVSEAADESTVTPGLFLAGPALAHRGAIFCFIYKFRQRFGVVARAIGTRLGVDTAPLEALRTHGFLLDDLSCCDDCAC